jgi:hypothetical protein
VEILVESPPWHREQKKKEKFDHSIPKRGNSASEVADQDRSLSFVFRKEKDHPFSKKDPRNQYV